MVVVVCVAECSKDIIYVSVFFLFYAAAFRWTLWVGTTTRATT
jgi:hypothetical protein